MFVFILKRVLMAIPIMFVIIALAFFLMRAAPGGPFTSERKLPPEVEANIRAAYDLDKSLPEQFIIYVSKVVRGDFGPSFKYKDFTVNELIARGAPVSLKLGLWAMTLALCIGIPLGTLAALRQNQPTDYSVMAVAMVGITVPPFVVAPLLTLFFGVYWKLLPVAGWNDGALPNMILPVTALSLPYIAYISRLTRGGMIEVLRSNYVRTARAKGLPESVVVRRHAMRAGLMPLVSYLAPALAGIVTGSVVIEQIFNLPGIGRYFVIGALQRDYTLVMGVIILYSALIITLNLISDVIYSVLDPKVKLN
ncbi:MAG: oligopeptide ABC transporter permease OppB [Alphaproteobacteria bacterium]|nr:MAG: oligopeptide ABC transporter permease OppB [Alphaproteobacteria bacterium]